MKHRYKYLGVVGPYLILSSTLECRWTMLAEKPREPLPRFACW